MSRTTSHDVRVEVAETLEAFEALESAWTAALDEAGRHDLHLSFPWLRAWWQTFGAGQRMCPMVAFLGDRAVGLAPLMIERKRIGGIAVPVLRHIGNHVSPRSDIVLVDRKAETVAALVGAMLARRWWWFNVGQVPAESEAVRLLLSHVGASFASMVQQDAFVTALVPLDCSWTEYVASRSRKFRRSLRHTGVCAGTHVLRAFPADAFDWDEMMNDIARVSGETWKHREGTSLVARRSDWEFYQRVMRAALAEDRLDVTVLYEAGEPVAFVIAVGYGQRLYGLKTGYRESHAGTAPGVGLIAAWLEREFKRKRWRTVDFDRATTDSDWKHRWAARTEGVVSYHVFRRSIPSRLAARVYGAKKWAESRRRTTAR